MATLIGEHTEHTFSWELQNDRSGKTLQAWYVDTQIETEKDPVKGGTVQGEGEGTSVSITSDTGPNGMNLSPGIYRVEVTYEADDGTMRPVDLRGVDRIVRITETHAIA